MRNTRRTDIAVFGGGCFWCVEAVFAMLRGVVSVTPGYAGGSLSDPTYEDVSSGKSGHVEVVRVAYEPDTVPFQTLLDVFFASHDPTTPDRQGADVGPQYRSVIFYTSSAQRDASEAAIRHLSAQGVYDDPIVTEVMPLETFYEAEAYHQNYYREHRTAPYCQLVIDPKIAKVVERFGSSLRSPEDVDSEA